MILPWQQSHWDQFIRAKANNLLSHAYLLHGMAGIGKKQFAKALTKFLLCKMGETRDCKCHDCHLIDGQVHPNVRWLCPEKTGQNIKIDQIREVNEFIQNTACSGLHKIVIIEPAEQMTMQAANALLKTLEEPTTHSIFLLISHQYYRLPPTVISRCQRVFMPKPEKAKAIAWLAAHIPENNAISAENLLAIVGDAPLTALSCTASGYLQEREQVFSQLWHVALGDISPLTAAASLQTFPVIQSLDLLISWVLDMIALSFGYTAVKNLDWRSQLLDIKHRISWMACEKWLVDLQKTRAYLVKGINLNKQLVLEVNFLHWQELTQC